MSKYKTKMSQTSVVWATVITAAFLCFLGAGLSVPVISDETITMSNAAWFEGYDWSLMVAALGGYYYRYIQALMSIPFFAVFHNPDTIYSMTMILQALIQASIVPVVYVICRRHLHMESKVTASLLGVAACLVPSLALYTFYFRGDYLLGVLPWYVLLTFLETMDLAEQKRQGARIVYTVLAMAFSMMAYMAHTRGVVLIIALFMMALAARMIWKKKSLHWGAVFVSLVILVYVDSMTAGMLKSALYSISGLQANAFESTDMGAYFSVFSVSAVKDLIMLCLSWFHTMLLTTEGLVLIGVFAVLIVLGKLVMRSAVVVSLKESVTVVFSSLVFAGYYAVGALFFKGTYHFLRSGELDRRVDRLLYDRYAICGAGMIVFVGLYMLCCRREWIKWKGRVLCCLTGLGVIGVFLWKVLPVASKYTGYIYNTITLNTFHSVLDPKSILFGEYYSETALIKAILLGIFLMAAVLAAASVKRKWMPYAVLAVVLAGDLLLITVNYEKIRRASNDYVVEVTEEVVDFMQELEPKIAEEYPYIFKGGLSGVRIQFYQSQLMSYKMFGKKQEEMLGEDNYFIINKKGDMNPDYFEDDYYLFRDFDYDNAKYDIVYVKGNELKDRLEELGYKMEKYRNIEK